MACFDYGAAIDLDTRETITLNDARGTTLRVAQGTLWITQEGDPRDVVLRTGDTWVVERDGMTVLEAQGAARFCILGQRVESLVLARNGPDRRPPRWAFLSETLATFFASPARGARPYV
ncbi:MAG TPA: DUF2917 domain-containing protein [Casimicrobiaceae bacterium]